MKKQMNKQPRLHKRSVAVLTKSMPVTAYQTTTLILVTTSGVTSTVTYSLDPPLHEG